MRFLQGLSILAVAVTAMAASAGAGVAHGYNGSSASMFAPASHHSYIGAWPVTVTRSQHSNGTGCLTLAGGASSGSAQLVFEGQKYSYGSFFILDGTFMATITEPLYGQNGALTFVGTANHGHLGQGVFENIEGGSNFDFGALAFGTKNGC
jgi:hypothetical protein